MNNTILPVVVYIRLKDDPLPIHVICTTWEHAKYLESANNPNVWQLDVHPIY